MSKKSEAALLLETHMLELGMNFFPEVKFCETRKWRADYLACKASRKKQPEALVEIEGGGYVQGRHVRGKGFHDDLIKYATATAMGYVVFRFDPQMIESGQAKEFLKQWLELKRRTTW